MILCFFWAVCPGLQTTLHQCPTEHAAITAPRPPSLPSLFAVVSDGLKILLSLLVYGAKLIVCYLIETPTPNPIHPTCSHHRTGLCLGVLVCAVHLSCWATSTSSSRVSALKSPTALLCSVLPCSAQPIISSPVDLHPHSNRRKEGSSKDYTAWHLTMIHWKYITPGWRWPQEPCS